MRSFGPGGAGGAGAFERLQVSWTTYRWCRGRRLKALESNDADLRTASRLGAGAAMDSYIPIPQRDCGQGLLMPIEDVFTISGGGRW